MNTFGRIQVTNETFREIIINPGKIAIPIQGLEIEIESENGERSIVAVEDQLYPLVRMVAPLNWKLELA